METHCSIGVALISAAALAATPEGIRLSGVEAGLDLPGADDVASILDVSRHGHGARGRKTAEEGK